jgi:hypothetical protein
MNSIRNLLLITIITATLVMGTSVIPMQSYADRGDSDNKKSKDFKSKISASYESDKKSSSQKMDQDNFCYRSDDCEQANQGQQLAGKDNEAKGFNDQSDNLSVADNGTGIGNGNGDGNGTFVICHDPPGNPGNPQTHVVNAQALLAHLAHGDTFGACETLDQ